jgi:hypothetical protein
MSLIAYVQRHWLQPLLSAYSPPPRPFDRGKPFVIRGLALSLPDLSDMLELPLQDLPQVLDTMQKANMLRRYQPAELQPREVLVWWQEQEAEGDDGYGMRRLLKQAGITLREPSDVPFGLPSDLPAAPPTIELQGQSPGDCPPIGNTSR